MPANLINAVVFLGLHCLELLEICSPSEEGERSFDVLVDGERIGGLNLLSSQFPRFSIAEDSSFEVVIWTESGAGLVDLARRKLVSYQHSDAITSAYKLNSFWCLVGDTSISVRDFWKETEISRFDHVEIIVRSFWETDRLVIEDLAGRRRCFDRAALFAGSLKAIE